MHTKIEKIFLFCILLFGIAAVQAQSTLSITGNTAICEGSSTTLTINQGSGGSCASTVNMYTGTTIVNCGSDVCFYDAGGQSGSYSNSTAYTHTFTSSNGSPLTITFNVVNVESSCDPIYVYDGTSTAGTLLNSGNLYNGLAGMTYTATSGSITVRFSPDGSVVYSGWEAVVSCEGASCDNYSYTWSNGMTGPSITVSPTQTTTYTVTATGSGCPSATGSVTVEVMDCSISPSNATITGQTYICEGSSTTLTANAEYDLSDCTQSVNMANTTTQVLCGQGICFYDTGGPNGSYANSTAYTHTFTSPNGSPITIHFINVNVESCDEIYVYDGASASGTLLNSGNLYSGLAGMTYTSTGGSLTIRFTPDGSVVYSGWYAIVYCTDAADFNYVWSNGQTGNQITVSPSQTTTYSVTVSGSGSGTATANVTVEVVDCSISPSSATITGQTMVCEGGSATLTANAECDISNCTQSINMANTTTQVLCGQGICFYDTGGPNGTYSNSTAYTHTFTSPNGSPITIHFINVNVESCDEIYVYDGASTSGTLLNSGNLYSGLAGMTYTSTGSSLTIRFTPDGSVVYSGWYAIVYCTDAADFNYVWSNGQTGNQITVTPDQTTTYTVTVSGSGSGTATASVTVEVMDCSISPGDVSFTGQSIICEGSTATITASAECEIPFCTQSVNMANTTTQVLCGQGICFYDSGGPNGNYENSTTYTHTFVSTNGGPITIHFDNVNVEGCDEIYIYDGSNTSGTLLNSGNLYSGLTGSSYTSTSGSITVRFTPDGSVVYSGWSAIIYCNTSEDFNYVWSNGQTGESISVSPTQTTTYTVTVSGSGSGTSTGTFTVEVVDCNVIPGDVTIEGNTTICSGSSTLLTASVEPSTTNCIQSVNMCNGTTQVICGPSTCFYDSGGPNGNYENSTAYTHTFVSANGSPITIHFNNVNVESCDPIYLYNGTTASGTALNSGNLYSGLGGSTYTANSGNLTVRFTPDGSVVYSGWSAVIYCNDADNFTYTWSNGQTGESINVSPNHTTTYTVTVTSDNGSSSVGSIVVNVANCGDMDGCPSIAPAELGTGLTEIPIDCDVTSVTLEANAIATALQTNSYTVISIPYNPPYAFTAGTRIFTNATDDTWGQALTLPFAFCFYGNTYTQIVPGANSVASFQTSYASSYCSWSFSSSLPSTNLFPNTIFACYRDIYPNYYSGDGIYQGVLGSYPCRSYVLSFNNIALFSCTSTRTFSSQIVLYEGTNIIDIYLRDAPTCSSWNSGNGVIGIQNSTGTVATVPPGRNTGSWTAHNEAWRFIPNGGEPVYTVTWYEGEGINGPVLGQGDEITVSPTSSTYYTARLQYTACNGDVFDITNSCHVTLNNSVTPMTVTASPDSLCANGTTTLTADAPGAISYNWSSGATTSTYVATPTTDPTTYTVTATYDNGCTSVGNVTVHVDLEPPTYSGSLTDTNALVSNCVYSVPDLTELIRPDATDNYTATPDLTITQVPAAGTSITSNTTVTVTIADECGNSSDVTVNIAVGATLSAEVGETADILCYGAATGMASVVVTTGNEPFTYTWSSDNGFPTAGLTDSVATSLTAGTYTVNVTDAIGCQQSIPITLNHLSEPMVIGTLSQDQDICRGSAPSAFNITGCSGGANSYYIWQQSTDNTTFTDIAGSTGTSLSPGVLTENTCYRVAYISDSCGTLYSNSVCVTLHDATTTTLFDTICQNTAYNANGFQYTAAQTQTPGDILDSLGLATSYGCDSTVYLNLTILPNATSTEERTIVENELPYVWNGVTFQSAGTQSATLTAANGCDSIVAMTLIVLPNVSVQLDTTVCETAFPFVWEGVTFNNAGTQQITLQAANGTDSVVVLTVHTWPSLFTTVNDEICQNEPYEGNGFTVDAEGTATVGIVQRSRVLTSEQGCDSTVTLMLRVHPIYDQEFELTVCDSLIWNGQVYRESGRYTQQFTSCHGCDSIVTKEVEVIERNLDITNLTEDFCEKMSATLVATTTLDNIQWSTGETAPQIEVTHAGTYTVTAHTQQCEMHGRVDIYPCPFNMYLPNAITPSASPGTNDYFFIPDDIADQIETCEFYIYDRWGHLIFQSTDPHFRWDGTSRGKLLSNYVFTYKLKVSVIGGGNYQYSGIITVL